MPFEAFVGRLNVKVTLEGHINELFWAITPIYFAPVLSLRVNVPFETFVHVRTLTPPHPFIPLPPPPPPPQKKKYFLSD